MEHSYTREMDDRWRELAEDPEFHNAEECIEFRVLSEARNDFVNASLKTLGI